MTRINKRLAAVLFAVILVSFPAAGAAAAHEDSDSHSHSRSSLEAARDATERFTSLNRAAAAGYGLPPAGPLHECISSFDNTGAMGFHYINGALLDSNVDARHPEALVYAPDRRGRLRLAALEYVVFQDAWTSAHGNTVPMLFGQMFMATGFPNRYGIPAFYSLHVWLYKHNPSGRFASFNPRVSCGAASAATATAKAAAAAVVQVKSAPRSVCRIGRAGAA